jgi:hypothetical protein
VPIVKILFDECVPDNIWDAVVAHNAIDPYLIDAVQVGKLAALPKQTPDDRILEWAEQNCRLLVSRDRNTMKAEHNQRLAAGLHSAGVLIIAPTRIPDLIAHLVLTAHATTPGYWIDRLEFFP